jgi:hypothetical protein
MKVGKGSFGGRGKRRAGSEVLALSDVSRVGGHPDELCYVACGVQGTWHVPVRMHDGSFMTRQTAEVGERGNGGLGRTVRGDLPSRDSPHDPINLYPAGTGLKNDRHNEM